VTPIRVLELSLHADSGGPGEFRGGLGIVLGQAVLADCDYHGRFERTRDAPWGFDGGRPGTVTRVALRHPDGRESPAPLKCEGWPLKKGDAVYARTSGGGGFGAPWKRDPERVRRDVVEGYVSPEAAREQYGVVLDAGTLAVDQAATRQLREAMKTTRQAVPQGAPRSTA
jgi:N-methylhydantoinase B